VESAGFGISWFSFDEPFADAQGQPEVKPALLALDTGAEQASSLAGTPALASHGDAPVPATPGDGRGTDPSTSQSDAPAVLAGILNTQSVAFGRGTRPGGPGITPRDNQGGTITLTVGNNNYIPLNANDTNNSPQSNGIPRQRDFNVQPMVNTQTGQPIDDPELIQATVTFGPIGQMPPNSLAVGATYTGDGRVRLWNNDQKGTTYTGGMMFQGNSTFYIEGTQQSSSVNDVTINARWTWADNTGQHTVSTSQPVTVTPITVALGVGPKNPPQVTFVNIPGPAGLNSGTQSGPNMPLNSGANGATFGATVTRSGVGGNARFIQNVYDIYNNGQGGVVYTVASGLNPRSLNVGNAQLPLLDMVDQAQPPLPDYQSPNFAYTTNTADTQQLYDTDTPAFRIANIGQAQTIDFGIDFQLYLIWRYPDNSIWTLGYVLWDVTFQANLVNGVLTIPNTSVVAADANFTLDHGDVAALTAPTFNSSFQGLA
jgi:hypothetical protein